MARAAKRPTPEIDRELKEFPPQLRWQEWMMRAEAIIFASPVPVERDVLSRVVGRACNIELLMEDLNEAVKGRAFELVAVAGGWQYRTRRGMADVITASGLVKTE